MAQRVGLAVALDLLQTPSVGTSAAVIAIAAGLARPSPASCAAKLNDAEEAYWRGADPGPAENNFVFTVGKGGTQLGTPRLKSIRSVYSFTSISFTVLRSFCINWLPVWNDWFQEVERREEEAIQQGRDFPDEWPPWPRESLRIASWNSLWATLRDVATLTVRRIFERFVDRRQSRYRDQLLTDFKQAALEYGSFFQDKGALLGFQCAPSLADILLRCNFLGAAADFTVSILLESWRMLCRPIVRARQWPPQSYALQCFGRICGANAVRCTATLCFTSLGAAAGAWLFSSWNRPYLGALAGMTAFDLGSTVFLISPLINEWAFKGLPVWQPLLDPPGPQNDDGQPEDDHGGPEETNAVPGDDDGTRGLDTLESTPSQLPPNLD